ncbi:MAG: sialate O-acetylesterase [Gemmataceae bacterium]
MKHCIYSMAAVVAAAMAAMGQSSDNGSKSADTSKPVKVFILMGQSNMVGLGKKAVLETAVKEKKKYGYLADADGKWTVRQDVRFVQFMQGKGLLNNDWLTVKGKTIGPEFGIGYKLGDAFEEPVMILKSCIGNRGLGWDLLPPGSERFTAVKKDKAGVEKTYVYAGYKEKPPFWEADPAKGKATEPPPWVNPKTKQPIDWYAGKNYDEDTADAKKALADLGKYYPGASKAEVAGFFFWQGERDLGDAVHAEHYEKNLVQFIKSLRKDFNSPNAKFVLGTLGEARKGIGGNEELILNAHLAVDGANGKYPEFKGNVATVYTHPMAQGGSGNGHYGGNAEVYMDVGEAMGKAMIDLFQTRK